jgi:hypothetical protein
MSRVTRLASYARHRRAAAGTPRATQYPAGVDLQGWVRGWLGDQLGERIAGIVADRGRIVQETIGVEFLATVDPAPLFRLG